MRQDGQDGGRQDNKRRDIERKVDGRCLDERYTLKFDKSKEDELRELRRTNVCAREYGAP